MLAAAAVLPLLLLLPSNEAEGGPDPLSVGTDVKDWLAEKFERLDEAAMGLSEAPVVAAAAAAAAAGGKWIP